MPDMPPRESFESTLDRHLSYAERARRRDVRYVYYAMLMDSVRHGPVPRRERSRLLRYARRVGIERFEAQLLIAGAEYRCSRTPGAIGDGQPATADLGFVQTSVPHGFDRPEVGLLLAAAIVLAVLALLVI